MAAFKLITTEKDMLSKLQQIQDGTEEEECLANMVADALEASAAEEHQRRRSWEEGHNHCVRELRASVEVCALEAQRLISEAKFEASEAKREAAESRRLVQEAIEPCAAFLALLEMSEEELFVEAGKKPNGIMRLVRHQANEILRERLEEIHAGHRSVMEEFQSKHLSHFQNLSTEGAQREAQLVERLEGLQREANAWTKEEIAKEKLDKTLESRLKAFEAKQATFDQAFEEMKRQANAMLTNTVMKATAEAVQSLEQRLQVSLQENTNHIVNKAVRNEASVANDLTQQFRIMESDALRRAGYAEEKMTELRSSIMKLSHESKELRVDLQRESESRHGSDVQLGASLEKLRALTAKVVCLLELQGSTSLTEEDPTIVRVTPTHSSIVYRNL